MNVTLPFTEIAGEKLSGEQTAYLEGLFAGLRNRGLTFSEVELPPPVQASKPPLDELIFEERVKRELHPLDAYPLLLENATANKYSAVQQLHPFEAGAGLIGLQQ